MERLENPRCSSTLLVGCKRLFLDQVLKLEVAGRKYWTLQSESPAEHLMHRDSGVRDEAVHDRHCHRRYNFHQLNVTFSLTRNSLTAIQET